MKFNLNILKEHIKKIIRKQLQEAPIPLDQPQQPNQTPNTQQPNTQQPQQQIQQNPQPQQPPQDPNVERTGNINQEQAAALIRGTKGKIFTVTFIKRSNNQKRVLNGRLGVKIFLRGGSLPYDPNSKNLIPVFDIQKREYRLIPIEGIIELKINNYNFKVQK